MFRTYVIDTWCIRQIVTTVTTARGDKKADLTNGRAAKLNMTTGSRVQSLPRTSRCVAFEKSAYLQREPPTPPPSLILSSEYVSTIDPCIYQFQTTYHICIETESIW